MTIDETVELLGKIALFGDFSAEQVRMLAFVSEDVSLAPGAVLYEVGAQPKGAFVLGTGRLVAHQYPAARDGYTIESPALVGELGLMLERPRTSDVLAKDHCTLLFIPRTAFLKLLRNDPVLAERVAARIREELVRYLDAVTTIGPRLES